MSEKQPYTELYPHLFSPMKAGTTLFKNRIFVAPTHLPNTVDEHGYLTREGATYFGNFAKGGAAAVHLGEVILDHGNSLAHEDHLDMTNEYTLQNMNNFNEYCHVFRSKTAVELNHSGHFAMPQFGDGSQPMSASPMHMPSGVDVRAMTEEDMDYVAGIYAKAANMAKRAGCDMVLMHYGHGWLMGGFLSPLINKRTDKYGGTLENRMRFPRMVLERVRAAVGPDFTIEVRINGEDAVPGGIVIGDTVEYVKMIEDLADLVHISAGNRLFPTTRAIMHPSHFLEQGHNVHLAETVKKSGVKIPVGAIGSIADPAYAEQVLAEGRADYILMARSWIADNDWAEKARAGRAEDIRPCIQCFRCQDIAGGKKNTATHNLAAYLQDEYPTATRRTECSVNPYHGNAMMKAFFPKATVSKKVVVIGGGPAGMEAAMEAAKAGHKTILFEKTGELGGQLLFAQHIWFKHHIESFRQYLIRQLDKVGVDVRLNTEATPELIQSENPDAVIVAVGAEPKVPDIENISDPKVVYAIDSYGREDQLGENVVIVGGGMTACETALHLTYLGKKATVVARGPILAPDGIYTERLDTLKYMDDKKVTVFTGTRTIGVRDTGVEVEDENGRRIIPADSVILCTGMKSLEKERDRFNDSAFDTIPVGDCVRVDSIKNAVSTAFDAVLQIGCEIGTDIPF